MDKKGHWYTDKNGKHYFVEEGQSPKEGWEQSNRRKMINNGKYVVDEGDGSDPREVSKEEYDGYEADESEFDETIDDDFGFDETEDNGSTGGQRRIRPDGQTEIRKSPDAPWEEVSREEYDETGYEDVDYEEESESDENEVESSSDDLMDPNNPKYKGFSPSHITNAKLVDEGETFKDFDSGEEMNLSIIEYIPYGALKKGEDRKLYGIVSNYDGSDAFDQGAIVAPSLESAKEQLKNQIELGKQGSERYTKRGKWDEEFFKMLGDKEYDWSDSDREKYSKKYGWDFSKPWEEQEHVKATRQDDEEPLSKEEFLNWHDSREGGSSHMDIAEAIYEVFDKNGSNEDEEVDVSYSKLPREKQIEISKMIRGKGQQSSLKKRIKKGD